MKLGITLPYVREREAFTAADYYGFQVTHHDFIEATLKYASEVEIDFFLRDAHMTRGSGNAVKELQSRYADKEIRIFPVQSLHLCTSRDRYVFTTPFDSFHSLAFARLGTQRESHFPISGVIHTLPDNSFFWMYCATMFWYSPGDVIVSTSSAGRKTLEQSFAACSEFLKRKYDARDVTIPKIYDIPLGVDHEYFTPGSAVDSKMRMAIPANRIVLLYAGRIDEIFKGDLQPLLIAFSKLVTAGHDVHLVVAGRVGRDDYLSRVRSLAGELGVEDRLTVKENFPYHDKLSILRASDIFVSPVDNVQETFGVSLIEAMAVGVPIVASDWDGYRDLVVHGKTGFLVPTLWSPAVAHYASSVSSLDQVQHKFTQAQTTDVQAESLYNHLLLLVSDKELRNRFGKAARARVIAKFSWKFVISKYEDLWKFQFKESGKSSRSMIACPLTYQDMFGHFATHHITDAMTVTTVKVIDTLEAPHPNLFPFSGVLEIARQIIHRASVTPTLIKDLTNDLGPECNFVIPWLIKKGHLEIEEIAPSENQIPSLCL